MVKNLTRNTVVCQNIKIASSLTDKFLGMILVANSGGLIFKTRFGIHTFLMKNKIDVLVVDKNNQVVTFHQDLSPSKIFIWNPKFDTVLELPEGSIKKSKTKLGDTINF